VLASSTELHHTPFGTIQQFLYCCCRVEKTNLHLQRSVANSTDSEKGLAICREIGCSNGLWQDVDDFS
jgi:hypothetical protein